MTFLAGQRLLAQQLADLEELAVPLYVRKTLDESVSNATMQSDNDLALPVTANAVYTLTALVFATCTVDGGDIAIGFSFPAGSRLDEGGAGPHTNAITGAGPGSSGGTGEWIARHAETSSPSTSTPYGAAQLVTSVMKSGLLEVGATAGILTLRWAQQAASGTTTVKAGSWLRLERMA